MDDIKAVAKKSKKGLESQDLALFELKQENSLLKQKITALESFISHQNTQITNEELICIEQINLTKLKSGERELSLDEVKRLDILIKNLRLIRNLSTDVTDQKDYRNVKEADLVAIARRIQED